MNHKPLHNRPHQNPADIKTINVEGIPEPIARTLEAMVALLRAQRPERRTQDRHPNELPVHSGTTLGKLTREEIYGDLQ